MNKNITFHIGLPKTGTTFLQKNVFTNLHITNIITGWNKSIAYHLRSCKHHYNNYLFTDEGFSGLPFKGNYQVQFENNVKVIKDVFGCVKIIFGVRNHAGFILSLYKQYLNEGGHLKFNNFFSFDSDSQLKPSDIKFEPKVNMLKQLFSDIHVYRQEDLKGNPEGLGVDIIRFIGEEIDSKDMKIKQSLENVGLESMFELNLLRYLNKINYHLTTKLKFPSVYHRVFQRLGITPRIILSRLRIGRIFNLKRMVLSPKMKKNIETYFKEDIMFINDFIDGDSC